VQVIRIIMQMLNMSYTIPDMREGESQQSEAGQWGAFTRGFTINHITLVLRNKNCKYTCTKITVTDLHNYFS